MAPRAPFDDADADIIFRSSDMIEFHLYKVIVAKASLVMHGMLTLPDQSSADRPQVVDLSENADTLDSLFRLCYPVEKPNIASLDQLQAVVAAALKYEMTAVVTNLRPTIKQFMSKDPLRVYAIAYQLAGMEQVAREAARALLDDPKFHLLTSSHLMKEFCTLPSVAVFALLVYRQECIDAALRVWEERDWVLCGEHKRKRTVAPNSSQSTWIWFHGNNGCGVSNGYDSRVEVFKAPPHQDPLSPCRWWWDYYQSLRSKLAVRPTGDILRSLMSSAEGHERAALKAVTCTNCRTRACLDLHLFNDLLADKIDAAVSKVRVSLPSDWTA